MWHLARERGTDFITESKIIPEKDDKEKENYGRIAIEFRGELFYNAGLDTPNLFSRFQWDPERKQWICPLNTPYSGIAKHIETQLYKRVIKVQNSPRSCNSKRSSSIDAPIFLHFEGGQFPKKFLWMFSNKLLSNYDLNKHDLKQDTIRWEIAIIGLVVLVLVLFCLVMKAVTNKKL
jgi:hypothetical protein